MVALNASTGKKLWKYKTDSFFKEGANISATSIIFEGNLIFPTFTDQWIGIQGHLYSIDARTGKVK